MQVKVIIRTVLLVAVFALVGNNVFAYVLNGSDGGDCAMIGAWDADSKTCTLNRNISYTESDLVIESNNIIVQISDSGITLDGNGHSILGSGKDSEMGVYIANKTGVTVEDLVVTGCSYGIFLTNWARFNTISNVTLADNMYGISITTRSNGNTVTGVKASGSSYAGIFLGNYVKNTDIIHNSLKNNIHGIMLYGTTNGNHIRNNSISNNTTGVYIGFSSEGNTVKGNTFQNNSQGLALLGATNNVIVRNNFSGRILGYDEYGRPIRQTLVNATLLNTFFKELPVGGNYWSFYDSAEEGCSDLDADGICDQPNNINKSVNSDGLPWTTKNGWLQ